MPGGAADAANRRSLIDGSQDDPGRRFGRRPEVIPDAKLTLINVFADARRRTRETADLVHRLREQVVPPAVAASTGFGPLASGVPPPIVSTSPTTPRERLPIFFGAVLVLSFLLLMVVSTASWCR